MRFDTEIYNELSKIQQSTLSVNKLMCSSTYYYSALLNKSLLVRDMLKRINADKNISEDLKTKINDCWYILNKACGDLI